MLIEDMLKIVHTSAETKEIAQALANAQAAMSHAEKNQRNSLTGVCYADLASVMDACRKALNSEGIAITQTPIPGGDDGIILQTMLLHKSGEWIKGILSLPVEQKTPQGFGSAMTYARRYGLMALAGVAAEDDDAESAGISTGAVIGEDLGAELEALVAETGEDIHKILAWARVEKASDLPRQKYEMILQRIRERRPRSEPKPGPAPTPEKAAGAETGVEKESTPAAPRRKRGNKP